MALCNWPYFVNFGIMMCQLVIGQEFSLSTNAPSRLVHTHNFEMWCGNEFLKLIFALDSLSEVVEGSGAFSRMRSFPKSRPTHMKDFDETGKGSASI